MRLIGPVNKKTHEEMKGQLSDFSLPLAGAPMGLGFGSSCNRHGDVRN
jgi:hypothetical protein